MAEGLRIEAGCDGDPASIVEAQLDQFVARDIRDLQVDLVSLKVGINVVTADSMRERAFSKKLPSAAFKRRDTYQRSSAGRTVSNGAPENGVVVDL